MERFLALKNNYIMIQKLETMAKFNKQIMSCSSNAMDIDVIVSNQHKLITSIKLKFWL